MTGDGNLLLVRLELEAAKRVLQLDMGLLAGSKGARAIAERLSAALGYLQDTLQEDEKLTLVVHKDGWFQKVTTRLGRKVSGATRFELVGDTTEHQKLRITVEEFDVEVVE